MPGNQEQIDERFKQVLTDPRFKTLRKKDRRIKVDSRFTGMFDKKFNGRVMIDKRGRPLEKTIDKSLKKFYQVSSDEDDEDNDEDDDEDEDDAEEEGKDESKEATDKLPGTSSTEVDETSSPIPSTSKGIKNPNSNDLRGENSELLSSSSDEESSEEEEGEEIDHNWGELDKDAPRNDNITPRLAVCNLDWDRIKAKDIYVLFNSFKNETGEIISVKIYPSQYGKARMEEEKIKGPSELTSVTLEENEEDPFGDDKIKDDDDIINQECPLVSEKLRQYQINRLKYFYAVVECDSKETAAVLYDQLNGMEYESSASTLDVRVIPDNISFDEDEPTSECSSMPPLDYKPPHFITTALQHSKVKLTWDETDPERGKTFQRAFSEKDNCADDLAVYLASSSGEESDFSDKEIDIPVSKTLDEKERIEKYKSLLKSLEEEENDEKDVDMEITWQPGLEDIGKELVEKKTKDLTVFERERLDKKTKKTKNSSQVLTKSSVNDEDGEGYSQDSNSEELASKTESDNESNDGSDNRESDENSNGDENTVNDEDALTLLAMEEVSDKKHFNYDDLIENKQSKRKRKKKSKTQDSNTEDNFQFDPEDPRFSAIYSSHLYNIDQSSSHFKKTKAIDEVLKRKTEKPEPTKKPKTGRFEKDSMENFLNNTKLKTSIKRKWSKT